MAILQDIPQFIGKAVYNKSWYLCKPNFEAILQKLRSGSIPEDDKQKKLINYSSGKWVYHCQVDGYNFAYKTQEGKTFWRYLFHPSLPRREFNNYQILQELKIPVPQVLAVGDTRNCFVMSESFLITEYLEDTQDGRVFMPGGKLRDGNKELCKNFCEGHIKHLATLHDAGYFHKAFHPRNLLFRTIDNNKMEFFWIDVARLRKAKDIKRSIIVDLHTFFRDMQLPFEEVKRLVGIYLVAVKVPVFQSVDEITYELVNFKRRAFSKRVYKICCD